MNAEEQIRRAREFLEANYKAELAVVVRKGENFLVIDFSLLSQFDSELAEILLEQPEDIIKAAELAVEHLDLDTKNFRIRIQNLPEGQRIMIRNIRSKQLGKLLSVSGIVRQKSDVRPQVTSAKFECPSCGNMINILQLDSSFREPSRCSCGRKGKFRLVDKELIDAQGLVLEEDPEVLEGGEQPKRINVILKEDLVSPMSEKKTNPGSKVTIIGQIKEVPIISRTGSKSTRYDLIIEANNVEGVEETFYDIKITEEEEAQIKEIAKDPRVFIRLVASIAPSIYGYDRIKEALVLQLMGGSQKTRSDGLISRGDIHVLLVGDPGAGKCISGSSRLILGDGEITSIESFYEKNASLKDNGENKIKVFSINENGTNFITNPIRFWRRKAPKYMLKIITDTGNELVVTEEHPLFTTENGLIFARRAVEYKKGGYIATPSKIDARGSLQSIPLDIKHSRANNKVKYRIKEFFDSDFARLLGYLIGDGYVCFRKTTGLISFTNYNRELLEDFENLIKRVFNLEVSKRKKQNSNCYEYYISSIELVKILKKIDQNIVERSGDMGISKIITRSPDHIIKEFLKSLFDCEGYVNKTKREMEFSSKSKDLIFDIKHILLRFGIISQISFGLKYASNTKDKIKRRYYRLRISGENLVKYYNEIGFVSKEKQKKLESQVKNNNKLNTNLNVVPNLNKLLKILRKSYNLTQFSFPIVRSTYQHYERGDRFPSYEKLREICKVYNELNANDIFVQILNQISKADIFWDKIKKIEKISYKGDYVYDLEIEEVHNFMANGVIVHNSQLLKRVNIVAPKGRYVSGKGVSGAGLTAAVVKDEFLRGWSLEAGALVLASNGIVCIDELDKMSPEDRAAMHEALEQQTISISKANIQATLIARTTVLAAANPKLGRFDPYAILATQIDLPPTLINRFDLIFPVKDLPNKKEDEKMASHILNLHQTPEMKEPEIPTKLLRKYFAYSRQNIKPILTDGAIKEIKDYYVSMRSGVTTEEAGVRAIPISPRQLEAAVRLSEASAKIRLSNKVTRDDAKRAINILNYCLREVGLDRETGEIDIDRISTGIPATERSKIVVVREIITELESRLGKTIPIDDVMREASDKGLDEAQVEDALEKLKRSGDLFEPRRGFLSRI